MDIQGPRTARKFLFWYLAPTQVWTWGICYYAFSVMVAPMSGELGWSVAEINGAFSLALMVSALSGLVMGRLFDLYGPGRLLLAGTVLAAILVAGWSQVDNLVVFYLLMSGIGLLMPCIQYESLFWLANHEDDGAKRQSSLGLITFFGGLASTVALPLSSLLLVSFGWRPALLVLSLILLAGSFLPVLLTHKHFPVPPKKTEPAGSGKPGMTGVGVMRQVNTWRFWIFTLALSLSGLAWSALSTNMLSLSTGRGIDPLLAAGCLGMIGIVQVLGRVIFSLAGARWSLNLLAVFLCLVQALAVVLFLVLPPVLNLIGFAIAFGLGHGTMTPVRAAMIPALFGREGFGTLSGMTGFASSIGRAVGPLLFGTVVLFAGSSIPALVLMMIASLFSLCLLLALGKVTRRSRGSVERPSAIG